jgi:cysteine desulfurase/selenocysteine lyase
MDAFSGDRLETAVARMIEEARSRGPEASGAPSAPGMSAAEAFSGPGLGALPGLPMAKETALATPSPPDVPSALPAPGGFKAVPGTPVAGVSTWASLSPPWPGTPTAPEPDGAGLVAFARRVREGNAAQGRGPCFAHDEEGLRRVFGPGAAPSPRPFDVHLVRRDFPALHQDVHGKRLVWMDNGATTQKPRSVIDAVSRFYERDNSNIHRGAHALAARATDAYEGAREKVRAFVGAASAKDIVFARGTTEAINLAAYAFGAKFLAPGDEILVSTLEHHADIVPWQLVAKERGAVLKAIPVDDRGEIDLASYEALLGPRTRIVALTQASNTIGTILPLPLMIHAAKRRGARVLVDGAQGVSHLPVDVRALGCDFYAFSGHKIFAPTGIGALYVHPDLQELLPPWQGGGNMIRDVTFERTTYSEAPARFEAGTPNIADAVGLGAALDYVRALGLAATGAWEHRLLERATEGLARVPGLRILGSPAAKVSVLSFVLKNHTTEAVGQALDKEGIAVRAGHHCAQPSLRRFGVETAVRPSFAFYNTFEEVDRLVEAVRRIAKV